jgi:hypothetical protein
MTKKNLNMLSKAELIALLETKETPAAEPVRPVMEDNSLLQTLLIKHLQKDESKGEDSDDVRLTIDLVNTSGMMVHIMVRDPFNGSEKLLTFDRTGATHKVSPRQLRELRTEYTSHFENGLLAVEGMDEHNPNVVFDESTFVDRVAIEDIVSEVQKITSVETLFKLFNYLENLRYGDPVAGTDALGNPTFTMSQKEVSPKATIMLTAVQRQIAAVSNVEVRLDS